MSKVIINSTHELLKENPRIAGVFASMITSEEERERVQYKVSFQWAQKDAVATATWVDSLPQGAGKENAAKALVNIWVSKDPYAAANWAIKLTDHELRDQTVFHVIDTWLYRDPETTAKWVTDFSDGELRDKLFILLFKIQNIQIFFYPDIHPP